MKLAILGAGNVGGTLGKGWIRAGHAVSYGVPDPSDAKYAALRGDGARLDTVAGAAGGAEAVVLAVPFDAVDAAISAAGDISGRLLLDVTNPLRMGPAGLELAMGFDRSGAEHVASLALGAAVFKTMNQVGFEVMADPTCYGMKPVMFVAGDHAERKPTVMGLVADLGFEAVDAGGLIAARLLEPFAMLWIHMALNHNMPRNNAFAYMTRGKQSDRPCKSGAG